MTTSRLFFITSLLSLAPLAQAGVPIRTIALHGDAVPGIPETATFLSFVSFAINDEGSVAFGAAISGPGINSNNNEGIWINGQGHFMPLARAGWTAPDSPGRTYSQFLAPLIADSEQVSFTGIYPGGFEAGIFSSTFGTDRVVARDGLQAPGMPEGVLFRAPLSSSDSVIADPAMNALGQTAFYSFMSGGSVGYSAGLWSEGSGSLSLVAYQGGSAPGTATGVKYSSFGTGSWNSGYWPVINDHGRTAFLGTLSGPGVTMQNENGIWSETSGILSLVARAGDSAPGAGPGVVFSTSLSDPTINNRNEVVFRGTVHGPGVTAPNDSGIWRENSSGQLGLVTREGSPAPVSGSTLGSIFSDTPLLSGSGAIVFQGSLAGPSIDTDNNTASWVINEGQLDIVAREGDQVPGLPDGVLFGDSPYTVSINQLDQMVILSSLKGSGVTPSNNDALFGRDATGELRLIARKGELFEIQPGVQKTVAWLSLFSTGGGQEGRLRTLNNHGEYVFDLGFTDGSRGLFVATIPEPATFTLLILGMGLFRRRRRARQLTRASSSVWSSPAGPWACTAAVKA